MLTYGNVFTSKGAFSKIACMVFLLCLMLITGMHADASTQNPYKNVSFHTLENGLSVVLSPGDKAENINVKVRINLGSKIAAPIFILEQRS